MAPSKGPATTVSGVDLNSARATRTPNITFKPWKTLSSPIVAFECANATAACMIIKKWLITEIEARVPGSKEFIRMNCLELDKVGPNTQSKLLMLEDIATMDGTGELGVSLGILGLFVPGDQRVRWFYSICSLSGVLLQLEEYNMIDIPKTWEPSTRKYRVLYTFAEEAFKQATRLPEHPDFVNAMRVTDYAAEIHEAEKALSRLLCQDILNQSKDGLDLEDDRYLLHLHDSERHIASIVELHCAEYLLIKRLFFKDFWTAVQRSEKKVEDGQKVRTDHAHQRYVEDAYGWTSSRAKKLIVGWRTLGLLNEKYFLEWTKKGGMLAYGKYEEVEDEKKNEEREGDSGVEAE